MELSENTLSVLKNFSGINQNILINSGSTIKTISEARNVLATAHVTEEFEQSFGIYDLNEFIGVLGLVDTPRLKFGSEHVVVGDSTGRSEVKYFFSAEETLTVPSKDIKMPEAEVSFVLTNDTLNKLKRAASTLGHKELIITGNNNLINLSVSDSQNSTANSYTIDVDGTYESEMFKFILDIENLKILNGSYAVNISSKLISNLINKDTNIQYWIALEKPYNYGG